MSDVRLPAPVKAQYFVDLPEEGKSLPGSFTFFVNQAGQRRGMIYTCPCGCGRHGSLRFRPLDPGEEARASWEWNGNQDVPTLTPSVHHVGHWHGWLRNGQWEQA